MVKKNDNILDELYVEGSSKKSIFDNYDELIKEHEKSKTIVWKINKVWDMEVKELMTTEIELKSLNKMEDKFQKIVAKVKGYFWKGDTNKKGIVNIPENLKEKHSPVFAIYSFIFLVAFFLAYTFNPYILLAYYDIKHSLGGEDVSDRDAYNFSQELTNNEIVPLAVGEIKEEHYDLIRRFYKQKQEESTSLAGLNKTEKVETVKPNLTKKTENKLELPFSLFVAKANKIVLGNGKNTSSLIYRDLQQNIQKELVENSVVSFYHRTPIIFSHSSWGSFNFWLFFLWLKKGDKVKIEGITAEGRKYVIPVKIDTIIKDIPWKDLNSYLSKINYNNNNIILDTCELDWTKRRVLIGTMEDIQFLDGK